jgi:hypothetical protein
LDNLSQYGETGTNINGQTVVTLPVLPDSVHSRLLELAVRKAYTYMASGLSNENNNK